MGRSARQRPGTAFSSFWDVGKWLSYSESPFSLQYRDNTPSIPTSEGYSKRPFKWNGIREGFEKHQEAHKSLGQGASSLALRQESWREAAQ